MRKKISLKGLEKIEIDHDNNVAIAIYREEKPILETGRWYVANASDIKYYSLFLGENSFNVGFINGYWHPNILMSNPKYWEPADMTEVERLLIAEAEKRCSNGDTINYGKFTGKILGAPYLTESAVAILTDNKDRGNQYFPLFDFKTGKWARIVEEKKPLYTNSLGTKFFEGDKCYWVIISRLKLTKGIVSDGMSLGQLNNTTEIMTKKECYQWLADHCEE